MKIVHVNESIDLSTGGPARSVTYLIEALTDQSSTLENSLYTFKSPNPIREEINGKAINFYDKKIAGTSSKLNAALKQSQASIFHGHGLWQLPVHYMSKIARCKNRPYIITPRGMLEPWPLKQSKLKKKIALALYQYTDLKLATCLHATAKSEAENLRKLGFNNPIAIIPNGIKLSEFKKDNKTRKNRRKILFLSRIHKKKGIELLIEAWSKLDSELKSNWSVDIIGDGDEEYIKSLKHLITSFKLEKAILIKKPIYGTAKARVYNQTDIFVLPSYSENFGIVVAEALASGTPVITTKATPWYEIQKYDCGLWIEPNLNSLIQALTDMIKKPQHELIEMGNRGHKLIMENYSMASVANKMNKLYNWVGGIGDMPEFVQID